MSTAWIIALVVAFIVVVGIRMRTTGADTAIAKQKIEQGALVIDVRTPEEYASGHFKGATNIPLADLPARIPEIGDKQKPIVVYCASGLRSARASRILVKAGFRDVTNAGGLSNLEK